MKTWEMIKALSENSEMQFRNGLHIVKISSKTKKVVWAQDDGSENEFIIYSHAPGAVDNLHIDWELVREPVDFLTAVKAFSEGKTITCEHPNYGIRRYDGASKTGMRDNQECAVNSKEILEGKWYLK